MPKQCPQSHINTTKAKRCHPCTDKKISVLWFRPFVWPQAWAHFSCSFRNKSLAHQRRKQSPIVPTNKKLWTQFQLPKMRSFMFIEATTTTKLHAESRLEQTFLCSYWEVGIAMGLPKILIHFETTSLTGEVVTLSLARLMTWRMLLKKKLIGGPRWRNPHYSSSPQ